MQIVEEGAHGRKPLAKRGSKGTEKGGKGDSSTCWTCGKAGQISASCLKGGKENLNATGEVESEVDEEAIDDEEELQAWCLLEASEHEQWQVVISRRDKRTLKIYAHISLPSVQKIEARVPRKQMMRRTKWAKVRVTMDS